MEAQKEKRPKSDEQSGTDVWDKIKWSNVSVIGVSEG